MVFRYPLSVQRYKKKAVNSSSSHNLLLLMLLSPVPARRGDMICISTQQNNTKRQSIKPEPRRTRKIDSRYHLQPLCTRTRHTHKKRGSIELGAPRGASSFQLQSLSAFNFRLFWKGNNLFLSLQLQPPTVRVWCAVFTLLTRAPWPTNEGYSTCICFGF